MTLSLIYTPLAAAGMDLQTGAFVVAFLVLSLGIHEAAHAWVANLCGDSTAKDMGRMTLNPVPHIDLMMTILLPTALILSGSGFIFGGAKPVPVSYHQLRKPARDMMLVALAGPISNILLAVVFLAAAKAFIPSLNYLPAVEGGMYKFHQLGPPTVLSLVLVVSVKLNILLAAFNMIPIPPLDGSRVLAYLLPERLRPAFQSLDRFSMILVFALIFTGTLHGPLTGIMDWLTKGLWTLTGGAWA